MKHRVGFRKKSNKGWHNRGDTTRDEVLSMVQRLGLGKVFREHVPGKHRLLEKGDTGFSDLDERKLEL